jgi:PPOX class probable F420-dependent enzyme
MATLTEKQAQLLLDRNFGSIATVNADGSPHVTPVWVDWDGEAVLVNTLRGRVKERNIARHPRVEILVYNLENPYQYVRVSGNAELVEENAEEHIDTLTQKYMGEDRYPWRAPGDTRVIVRVRPDRVSDQGIE